MAFLDKNTIIKMFKKGERLYPSDLTHRAGGKWLGKARNWIKWKSHNGDSVEWGSNTPLKLTSLTVAEIEAFAAEIALATLEEFKGNIVTDDERKALDTYARRENWRSAREGDNDGNCKVFDPNHNKMHFAHPPVVNGWEVAEFDSEKELDRIREKAKSYG